MSVDWVRGVQVILSCGLGRLSRLSVVRWSRLIRAYVWRYRVISLRICSFVDNFRSRYIAGTVFDTRGDCCASLTLTQTLTLTIATLIELVICIWKPSAIRSSAPLDTESGGARSEDFGHREWWV